MKKIIIYGFLFCLLFVFVNADSMCFPAGEKCGQFIESIEEECKLNLKWRGFQADWGKPLGDYYTIDCYNVNNLKYSCSPYQSNFLAVEYFKLGNYFYADIEKVVFCPKGCDTEKNVCKGGVPIPTCSEKYEKCENNNVYECRSDGKWYLDDTCGDFTCVEYSATEARCKRDIYFCNNGITCYSSSNKLSNCYETEEDCRESIEVWCMQQNSVCIKRKGSCLSGEREFRSTLSGDMPYECQEKNDPTYRCDTDENCPEGYHCVEEDKECKPNFNLFDWLIANLGWGVFILFVGIGGLYVYRYGWVILLNPNLWVIAIVIGAILYLNAKFGWMVALVK